MDVATYELFCLGCHIHVLIEGWCQVEGAIRAGPLARRAHGGHRVA